MGSPRDGAPTGMTSVPTSAPTPHTPAVGSTAARWAGQSSLLLTHVIKPALRELAHQRPETASVCFEWTADVMCTMPATRAVRHAGQLRGYCWSWRPFHQ
eukprot:3758219-Pyramimonas_sp.AAC.1